MWTCARLATVRSPSANARPSRNSLKPCFVENRTGTRASRPGHLPVGVGMDEVRVQDLGPVAGEIAAEVRRTRSGRRRAGAGSRRAGRPGRVERTGEVPCTGLVLVQHQHPDVPAALAQPREQREQVRLGAGDAGDLLQVEDSGQPNLPLHATQGQSWDCPCLRRRLTRPPPAPRRPTTRPSARRRPARAAARPSARRSSGGAAAERDAAGRRGPRASSRSKRSSRVEQRVECRDSRRSPARSSRTPRTRPCRSRPARMLLTSTSARASTSGTSRAQHGVAELDPPVERRAPGRAPRARRDGPAPRRSAPGPYTSSRTSSPSSTASRTARRTVSRPFALE